MACSCSSGSNVLDVSPLWLLTEIFLCDKNWLGKVRILAVQSLRTGQWERVVDGENWGVHSWISNYDLGGITLVSCGGQLKVRSVAKFVRR
jgi:hypothetical protein